MRYQTSLSDWVPSIHKIHNTILFATADELILKKVMPYGKPKNSDKVTITKESQFVSLILSAAKAPFLTRLTIFAKKNGFNFLTIADDIRQSIDATSLLGLAIMLPQSTSGVTF